MNPHRTAEDEHPIKQPPPETGSKPELVNNIPMHNAGGPAPIKDGDDMDELMQEVGKELKKDDHRQLKKHWFSKKKHKDANFQAAPVQRHHDLAAPAHTPQPHSAALHPIQSQPAVKSQPKPRDKSSAPIMVITVTIIITGILIAAAISAYK